METARLGPLTVSRLALGTMLMGAATPEDEAYRILDRFLAAGGTFVDTADVYGDGTSERVLAPWLARHRDEVVLATKVRFKTSDPAGEGLAPDRIAAACEASLRRLGVDVIDLYQVHAPDPAVPLEETLEALDALVRAGKVRALGASNFPAWLLAWAVSLQDRHGWSPFVSLQPQYSLVERSIERSPGRSASRAWPRRSSARARSSDLEEPAAGPPGRDRGRARAAGGARRCRSRATRRIGPRTLEHFEDLLPALSRLTAESRAAGAPRRSTLLRAGALERLAPRVENGSG